MTNYSQILIPFLKAGINVLSQITSKKFHKKEVYPMMGDKSIGDVKIEIEVIGDIKSRIVIDMPRTFAFKLAKSMLEEIETEENVELMQSAILEVGNMITGNAMGYLEEQKLDCDIKTPKSHIGHNLVIFNKNCQIGVIEFSSEIGDFNLYVLLKEESDDLDATGILLFNIPEVISNSIIEFFIPKMFSVYSSNEELHALQIIEKEEVALIFINNIHIYNFDVNNFINKVLEKKPNTRFIFYSSPNEWNQNLITKHPNIVLGYIPRAFDSIKTAKALIVALEKIGIKYNPKRKHIRINITDHDKVSAILYKDLKSEDKNDIINVKVNDVSLGGALIEVPLNKISDFKQGYVFPRFHLKLKGYVLRPVAKIVSINESLIGISFVDITEDDTKKISFFVHEKLKSVVKVK